jgi:hypothetical protein
MTFQRKRGRRFWRTMLVNIGGGGLTPFNPIVQFAKSNQVAGTSLSLAYPKNVQQGNILLVIGLNGSTTSGSEPQTISDTMSNSWTEQISSLNSALNETVYIWTAIAKSTGATTITLDGTGVGNPAQQIFLFELSGLSTAGITSSSGNGISSPMTVTSFDVLNMTFVGVITDVSGSGTMTGTSGFTVKNTAATNNWSIEYAQNASSPNTCSMSYSLNSGKNWAMAAVSLVYG